MCYVCLKDNLVDLSDEFAKKYGDGTVGRLGAKAIYIKQAIKMLEQSPERRCEVGDGMLERLKEEQYRLARQL